ncbi:MAG: DUF2147 domain-containing protein [Burkholderiaceae bacterium]
MAVATRSIWSALIVAPAMLIAITAVMTAPAAAQPAGEGEPWSGTSRGPAGGSNGSASGSNSSNSGANGSNSGASVAAGASLDEDNPAMTPVGLWRTIDDLTGKARSLVRIRERGGVLVGRIEQIFEPSRPNPTCDLCPGDSKGQPIEGLQIIRELKRFADRWADGQILNPEDGKVYNLRATPVDGGRKLEMHGYIGLPLLGRTQTWIREQ